MAKRRKKKKTQSRSRPVLKQRLVILWVITMAMASIAMYLLATRPTEVDKLSNDYLDTMDEDVRLDELVKNSFSKTYSINDFTFYGESLKFYKDSRKDAVDPLMGLNIILRNVETKEEKTYTFGDGREDGIRTNTLTPGLYEIYVYDHFVKKRIYFSEETHLDSPFETLRRNGKVLHVGLDADRKYLEDRGIKMDKNYAFISVTENIPRVDTIDVLIDPCGDIYDPESSKVVSGVEHGRWKEQTMAYSFAKEVKKSLEAYGLRVELSRTKNGSPGYYGQKGRVGKGYEKNAKVFLSLGFSQDDEVERPYIVSSAYSSCALADRISYVLQQNGIELDSNIGSEESVTHSQGVISDTFLVDGSNADTLYEYWPQLRESGGKATFAGQNENSKENQRYKDSNGMYGIYFMFANAYDNDSMEYYQQNKKTMARSLAESVAYYYDLGKEESDETNN